MLRIWLSNLKTPRIYLIYYSRGLITLSYRSFPGFARLVFQSSKASRASPRHLTTSIPPVSRTLLIPSSCWMRAWLKSARVEYTLFSSIRISSVFWKIPPSGAILVSELPNKKTYLFFITSSPFFQICGIYSRFLRNYQYYKVYMFMLLLQKYSLQIFFYLLI